MQNDREDALTFVCRASSGASLMVDIKPADGVTLPGDYARRLLAQHASSAAVKVWKDDELVDLVQR